MATISVFPALQCYCTFNSLRPSSSSTHSPILPARSIHLRTRSVGSFKSLTLTTKTSQYRGMRRIRSAIPEQLGEPEPEAEGPSSSSAEQDQQSVSVPVSPPDKLLMIFQAEGIMNESAIPKVTQALEAMEDIFELNVQVFEGLATVECVKQTTAQATGVASGLVETIQGLGFKLQTLNLSFEEGEEAVLA